MSSSTKPNLKTPAPRLALRLAVFAISVGIASGVESVAAAQQTPPAPTPAPSAGEIKMPTPTEYDTSTPAYTYEVGGRRDPFRSLLIRNPGGPREGVQGLAGMLVDELELQGTIKTKAGWVAMMRGADNKSYLVRKGATVFDGEVTDVTASEVTFRQNVNDPASPKPFRDVVKTLGLQKK